MCCACNSESPLRNCCNVCNRSPECVRCALLTRSAPTFTPTAEARSSLKLRHSPLPPEPNFPTSIFPSPAWRTYFCTIPEGACAIELEMLWRHAGPRRPCGAPQCRSTFVPNFLAASSFRLHLRQGHGRQRLHACFV